jgi:DNA-directed RNA polymerase specialized sigma24 family protein
VFASLARDLRRFDYDPARGSFRGWLLVVVRNQLVKQLARERRTATVGSGGDDSLFADLSPQTASWRSALFRGATQP